MQEVNRVTEDTPINSDETKELIERLSDPSFVTTKSQATIRDLAETLDMDPAQVITGLEQLRAEKAQSLTPKTETYQSRQLSPSDRKMAMVLIFIALAISMLASFFLMQRPAMVPPMAPTRVITGDQTAPPAPLRDEPPKGP